MRLDATTLTDKKTNLILNIQKRNKTRYQVKKQNKFAALRRLIKQTKQLKGFCFFPYQNLFLS
jgi:hypothetical protein